MVFMMRVFFSTHRFIYMGSRMACPDANTLYVQVYDVRVKRLQCQYGCQHKQLYRFSERATVHSERITIQSLDTTNMFWKILINYNFDYSIN